MSFWSINRPFAFTLSTNPTTTQLSLPLYLLFSLTVTVLLRSHQIQHLIFSMDSSRSNQSGNLPSSDFELTLPKMYNAPPTKLYKDFLNNPTLSDITIRLGDKSWYAHRIVLCRGSEYFDNMLTGRFQVRQMSTTSSNKVLQTDLNNRSQHPRRSSSTMMIRMRSSHFCASSTTCPTTPKPTQNGSHLCIRTLRCTWWRTNTKSTRSRRPSPTTCKRSSQPRPTPTRWVT